MSRALAAAVLVTALLPEQCNALLAKGRGASAGAASAASARAVTPPPPANDPSPPLTPPPVWTPPVVPASAPPPARPEGLDAGRGADGGKPSPELRKALVAFEGGEHKKVRALLEKKVKAGKGTPEEVRLVASSCAAMNDKPCVEAMRPLLGE